MMQWDDGSVFEGQWVKDKRVHGQMKMIDGGVYTGKFMNDAFHGQGRLELSLEDIIFEGEFENGKVPRKGKLIFPDGDVYEGDIDGYKRHGKGKLYMASGGVFEGQFMDDQIEGKGRLDFPDSSYYVGEFMDGRRDGYGRFYDAESEEIYEGNWLGDLKSGEGKLFMTNGEVVQGNWR